MRETFLPQSETFVRDHVLGIERYTPVVLTSARLDDALAVPGVPIEVGQHRSLRGRALQRMRRRRGASELSLRQSSLAASLRHIGPDLVHAHFGPDAALVRAAAVRQGLPLVVTFHGYDVTSRPTDPASLGASMRLLLNEWDELMRDADAIVTVSEHLRERLVARGADPERLHVVPCGVNTATVLATPAQQDGPVLFVGRLVEKKGCTDALRAVSRMRDPRRLVIIGDGLLRGALEVEARALGVDVTFAGWQSSSAVREAMASSSVILMPSRPAPDGDSEGLPVVAQEAAAAGRVVVGYDSVGMSEAVVDGVTGRLVPEGDVDALAAALDEVLRDWAATQELALAARERAESVFDSRLCLGRIESIYDAVCGCAA